MKEKPRNRTAKTVSSYRHPAPVPAGQEPDTEPGNYYVSVRDGERFNVLLGPFVNNHAGALAHVNAVRARATQRDPFAAFYGFGTVRMNEAFTKPGILNRDFPALFDALGREKEAA